MPRLRWNVPCSAFRDCGTDFLVRLTTAGRAGTLTRLLGRAFQTSCLGGDRRLAIGGLILMDDALRSRLVQGTRSGVRQLGGFVDLTGVRSLTEPTNGCLQRRLRRLVTLTGLLVGLDSFELGLDVRHDRPLELLCDVRGRCCASATDHGTSGAIGGPNSP